jgi:methylase of polypeptide subunit release factors
MRKRARPSSTSAPTDATDIAVLPLVSLGKFLQSQDYQFTTITPASHRRVVKRNPAYEAENLTDIFGWSRRFRRSRFESVSAMLEEAGELERCGELFRSKVRFSALAGQLYVHSAFPTDAPDSVFFGPDTYRFARAIQSSFPNGKNCPTRIIDLGCGSGAGGIFAASLVSGERPDLVLVDINEKALRYSRVNCILNGTQQTTTLVNSDLFASVSEAADLIISNPPYLVDPKTRVYRHGGANGYDLSLRIAEESLNHLRPGGRLILYTGAPIVGGEDRLLAALTRAFAVKARSFHYEEIDPDVFGEELDQPFYAHVDRIAAVSVVVV